MPNHREWVDARYARDHTSWLTADEVEMQLHPEEEQLLPALVIDSGGALIVLEGTPTDLNLLAQRLLVLTIPHLPPLPSQQ